MLGYFGTETVTATLHNGAAGTNVKGVWTPGLDAGVTIRMIAPQPVKADELTNLPDGEHVSDYLVTWAETSTLGTREGLKDADRIDWDGDTYKVVQADNRQVLGGFMRVVMRRLG